MIKFVTAKILPSSYQKVKNASNVALSRTHYINFLKEENKFFESAKRFEDNINNWSLKSVPEFALSVKHVAKMGIERLKSVYFSKKL